MKHKTGQELQEYRRRAAERFYAVGLAILEEAGVETWEFHERGLRGYAEVKRKHVECPKPTTRRRLYILAHECGHIALSHKASQPRHRKEFEAEQYAHDALRRHGVPVPRKSTESARRNVARRIDQAVRLGRAKKLDRRAVPWCTDEHGQATRRALRNKKVDLTDSVSRQQGDRK